MPHTSKQMRERLNRRFPGYFDGSYYEKEDTNLGDELFAFIEEEIAQRDKEWREKLTGFGTLIHSYKCGEHIKLRKALAALLTTNNE